MSVRLVTPSHSTVVRLVRSVYMHVLLSVTGVGKTAITTIHFTLKRLFTCKKQELSILETDENYQYSRQTKVAKSIFRMTKISDLINNTSRQLVKNSNSSHLIGGESDVTE